VSPAGGNFEEPVTQATLKVVGAFHGLSRERSDARKYPAVHPLDSWSKYASVIDNQKVNYAKQILFSGNEVSQMMKVVGEEGTSLDDYIVYLKSELIDSVYLQQNSFDPVDFAAPIDRQEIVFDVLFEVLGSEMQIEDKKAARSFINELRQKFIDWNNTPREDERFEMYKKEIKALVSERFVRYERKAARILQAK